MTELEKLIAELDEVEKNSYEYQDILEEIERILKTKKEE